MPNLEYPTFNPEEELDEPIDAPLSPENKKMSEANIEKSKKPKSENPYLRSIRKGADANAKLQGSIIEIEPQPVKPSQRLDTNNQFKENYLINRKTEKETPRLEEVSREEFEITRNAFRERKKLNN